MGFFRRKRSDAQRRAMFAKLKNSKPNFTFQENIKLREHFRLRKQIWSKFLLDKIGKTPQQRATIFNAIANENFNQIKPLLKRLSLKEQAQAQIQFKNIVKNKRKQDVFGNERQEFDQVIKLLKRK